MASKEKSIRVSKLKRKAQDDSIMAVRKALTAVDVQADTIGRQTTAALFRNVASKGCTIQSLISFAISLRSLNVDPP